MTITPDWIIAICAILTFGALVLGGLLKLSQSIDKLVFSVNSQNEKIKAQWSRIDEHTDVINEHSTKITKLETWKEIVDGDRIQQGRQSASR